MFGASRLLRSATTVPALVLLTAVASQFHAKPLTAGLIDIVLVVLIAFRWGFIEAAVASVAAVALLDFFYMPPLLSFYENDPQDWISSGAFATIALLASRFADKLRKQAIATDRERTRLEQLYVTSRDILMMERKQDIGQQLTRLIEEIFKVEAVAIWDAREFRLDKAGENTISEDEIRAIYFNDVSESDARAHTFKRVLRLGTRPVGALYLAASPQDSHLDSRSADAIASLAAIALERAHSFISESSAQAARQSEQLRSAVLDGLAHAFKTPLATIQTASSGLLEVLQLGTTGHELVTLIDLEASRLATLTDTILQTAKLDRDEFQVNDERIDLDDFLQQCNEWFAPILINHPLELVNDSSVDSVWADLHLLRMALFQYVDNAAKYATPGSLIMLCASSTDSEVWFSVQNEGSYIPPHESLRIFQRFYRSPGAQYKASGTGIGLSVTHRIAEAHHGRVWVVSTVDSSTTFFLAMPQLQKEICSAGFTRQTADR